MSRDEHSERISKHSTNVQDVLEVINNDIKTKGHSTVIVNSYAYRVALRFGYKLEVHIDNSKAEPKKPSFAKVFKRETHV